MPVGSADDPVPGVVEITFDDAGADGLDTIEPAQASIWWQQRRTELGLVAAALVVVAVVAFLVGRSHSNKDAHGAFAPTSAAASASPSFTSSGPALYETGAQCATQIGGQLDLGIEIANRSSASVQLQRVDPVLPLGGLRVATETVGPCGSLGSAPAIAGATVRAGASVWVNALFDVLVTCPKPLPVQFNIGFAGPAGAVGGTAALGGFADLGSITYSGCDSTS